MNRQTSLPQPHCSNHDNYHHAVRTGICISAGKLNAIGGKQPDLPQMYRLVVSHGGHRAATVKKAWKSIGGSPVHGTCPSSWMLPVLN